MGVVEADLKEIKTVLRSIEESVNKAKGGWLALVGVAGIAGAVGSFLTKTLALLAGKGLP